MPNFLSVGELAELLGTDAWRVRRVYERGDLPEPPRFAGKRAIPRETVADVAEVLRKKGWLPTARPRTANDRRTVVGATHE